MRLVSTTIRWSARAFFSLPKQMHAIATPIQPYGNFSPCGLPNETTALEEKEALENMVTSAVDSAKKSFHLNADLAYAVVSAEETGFPELHIAESRMLNNGASGRKQANWIAGRAAARLALKKLGLEDSASVLRGDLGEPIWPDGFSGSITHCYPWSIAVAAKSSSQSVAVGIDLESSHRMRRADPAAIVDLICREPEREWVQSGGDLAERLTIVFSAKEALYKSLYPICKRYIDFTEVELAWRQYESCFRAEFLTALENNLSFAREYQISCQQYKHLFFASSIYRTA